MAFVYGILYCMLLEVHLFFSITNCWNSVFLTTMPAIFSHTYNERPGVAGLHYIALGVGLSISSQANARFMDKIYVYYKKKNGGVGEPEFRLRKSAAQRQRIHLMKPLLVCSPDDTWNYFTALRPFVGWLVSPTSLTLDCHRYCMSFRRLFHVIELIRFFRVSLSLVPA